MRNYQNFCFGVYLKLAVLLISLFPVVPLFAQHKAAGMNLGLRLKVMEDPQSMSMVHILIKGVASCVEEMVLVSGGTVIAVAGDITSARMPLNSLSTLLEATCVSRIESFPENMKILNDTMRMLCRVNEVHLANPPLTQDYKGRNVLIGYIDSGLDLNHPDFKDSLGMTRVAWLWDMTKPVASNTPQPYGYGQEWSAADIDNGLAVSHTGEDQYGHGTYVAGIGSGNGFATGNFRGVAPESDIMIVSYDFNATDTVPRMAHAIDYLFSKAVLAGKPCVINASLGDYIGSHDGRDLQSQFISNLINMQSGRVVVAAAGNIGLYPFHVGRTSTGGDTAFTWFKYNAAYGGAYIQLFGDTADFSQISFAIGADKVSPYFDQRGILPFTNISSTLNNVVTMDLYNGLNRIGIVQTLATLNDDVYMLEVYVSPDSSGYYWRFASTGIGHFDSWSFDWEFQNLPSPALFPPILHYHLPDTFQTIVTGPACLDNVITVGNFFNTDRHVDVNGSLQITPGDQPGNLAGNSSRGPTRDGRIKPEISAPGHHIISAGVLTQIPGMIAAQPWKVAQGGFHVTGGGTSASAPVIAGIAALYLEQNPSAGWQDVKAAILNCAATDSYTWGPLPNNAWGYGKADAFNTLTACSMVSIDNAEREAKTSPILYPNPSGNRSKLLVDPGVYDFPLTLMIYSVDGRLVKSISLNEPEELIELNELSDGYYFLGIEGNFSIQNTMPFILQR